VVVVWAGGELDRFLDVLAGYDGEVEVTSAGDDIDALLRARRRTGNSPDVAIISRPGLIRGYVRQGWLSPVASRLANRYPAPWNDLLRFDGDLYGVWLKAAHKSLFWHRSSTLDHAPSTWDELVDQVRRLATGGSGGEGAGRAPLAVGAADGWVLTDWLENLLAAQATPQLYQALGRGHDLWDDEAVRESLTRLAQLWSVPGAFPGGGRRALLTQFDQSAIQLATGRAALLYGADFASSVLRSFSDPARQDGRLRSFRFPSPTEQQPLVVGGDAAVVFDDSPRGHRLAEWLADGRVFLPWVRAGGYLSPNTAIATDAYPDPLLRSFAVDLREPDDGLHFDLSDQLPAQVNGQDGQGSWAILQDFFAAVTTEGADLGAVVERAVTRLADEVRRARQAEDEVALR
jgi:ABC-type glycerol-3-phosphate transport system substrate-binding protein